MILLSEPTCTIKHGILYPNIIKNVLILIVSCVMIVYHDAVQKPRYNSNTKDMAWHYLETKY